MSNVLSPEQIRKHRQDVEARQRAKSKDDKRVMRNLFADSDDYFGDKSIADDRWNES
jgi:hypothetical protein